MIFVLLARWRRWWITTAIAAARTLTPAAVVATCCICMLHWFALGGAGEQFELRVSIVLGALS